MNVKSFYSHKRIETSGGCNETNDRGTPKDNGEGTAQTLGGKQKDVTEANQVKVFNEGMN